MKKIINILILLFVIIQTNAQSQPAGCCPEFSITTGFQPCDKNRECDVQPANGGTAGNPTPGQSNQIIACKNQAHTYLVVPNLPGFTYTWTVVGGTPNSATANPVVITWGGNNQGYLQVIITNAAGTCRDTIRKQVCLIDGPKASFTFSPNPVCLNTPVCFNSSASVGANYYYWDFGDGTSSTLPNPCHTFTTPGPHTVVLTVFIDTLPNCGCKDTARAIINVSNKKGIDIYTDDCRKMLCAGDTVKYCTSATGCTFGPTPVAWTVNGGTIISGQNTNCITVVWNVPPTTLPTSVTLNANCPGTCGNTATLNVPVLFPNLPIQGPNIVCPGVISSYSLPALPGTFYSWTISGGGTISAYDSNHNIIHVQWGTVPGGMHIITCNYNNPYSGCSGTDTIGVYIKPRFQIPIGPSPVCTNTINNYFANGPVGTWIFNPNTGFTNTPIGASGQAINWSVAGNNYSITAIPLIPTNYCTPSATINVVVNPTPLLNPIVGPIVVCPNQLYNYTASSNVPGGIYTWQFTSGTGTIAPYGPNNSSASILFGPGSSWTIQVTQTINGCQGIKTLTITKTPAPTGITLSLPGTCSGGSITATAVGGNAPYTWTTTPGAVLTGMAGATATFTINSAAIISVANCSGSVSTPVTVTPANVSLAFVLGNCNATITASPAPVGSSFVWYLNGNLTAYTGSSIVVTQNGNYVVVATYPGGCKATSQITVSGITPVLVSISGTGNLCNGGSFTLVAAIQANCPGAVFTWSNGFVGNPLVVNTPGSYFVNVTCSNGCTAKSNTIVVQPCTQGPGCIPDLILNPPSNCPNPIALTTNIPAGCTPVSTTWLYGDGFGGPTGNHLYNTVGNYTVWAMMTCADGSKHCGTRDITIPMVDSFTRVVTCGTNGWNVQLQDASTFLPAYAGYSILWTTTCGSLSANNTPNPTLTVPFGCNPTVTLTISNLGCTLTKSFTFGFPTTAFAINGPSTVCKDANNVFSSNYTTGVIAYAWNFGDATSGVTNPITHAFNGSPANPNIILQITDQFGCTFTATKPVTVITPTPLTISPSPIVKICPDCTPPVTLTTSPVTGFTNYQWYQNGAAIPLATNATYQLCNFNSSGSYYVTAVNSANNNCPVTSDTVNVVYLPKPLAHILGQTVQCAFGTGPFNIYLQNQGGSNPNYTYLWTATGPGSVAFSPNNTQFDANASVSQLGTYQFILTVTDINTGCKAKDTFCVYLYLTPTVTITAPANMCEGTLYTLTANPTPAGPNYIYQWNNGATTPSIVTGLPGSYTVSITDPVSGCIGSSSSVKIKKRPYVDLFPIGCDTLCDTVKLIPPLPLAPGQTYNGVYTIQWFVDGNYHSTGPVLNLGVLSLGQHQIYIIVTDIVTGCKSTSGNYDLFIKHCAECDCKESHWGEIQLTQGEKVKAPAAAKNNVKANVPVPIILKCNSGQKLDCNKTYTIDASYFCKDTACSKKVTYVLQPGVGSPITGSLPLTFTTPNSNTTYILTLYGWCGDKICDSCVIDLIVQCDSVDCCKGSVWEAAPWYAFEKGAKQKINCSEKEQVIEISGDLCKQKLTFGATIKCPPNCISADSVFVYDAGNVLVQSGPAPLTLNTLADGTYTVQIIGYCGGQPCLRCKVTIKINCDKKCDCNEKEPIQLSVTGNDKIKQIRCGMDLGRLDCNTTFTIAGTYTCNPKDCPSNLTYTMTGPGGPVTGTLPLTINTGVLANGTYTILIQAYCNGKLCKECKITFTVECERPCCPYKIEATAGTVNYNPTPTSTIAAQTFTINGLALANITEVRANVVSYTITDNFGKECMKCVNLPFTWASVASATNIGVAPGLITMYGGTGVPSFSGTGAGAYQNPREVIWNNGTPISIPNGTNIGMSFILPPVPAIDCCELKGKICVKFTFRDNDCKECEVIACFDIVIKKK